MSEKPAVFPWNTADSKRRVQQAVEDFWKVRAGAGAAQRLKGNSDAGTRGDVTAGKHLHAFASMIGEVIGAAGFTPSEIRSGRGQDVPGYFRSQKNWDLVVIRENRLCAAIEFKSQVGSFGNNINNRSEEALGSSTDFWVSFREGALGKHRPWLGYFMVVQDHPKARKPIRNSRSPLAIRPEFIGSSYLTRYSLLCERMVLEGQYSAAALLAAPKESPGEFSEPSDALRAIDFMRSLFGHLIGTSTTK